MSDVMGITRLSHLCTVDMVIQYMHAVLGNHKTMTHQYVNRGLIVFTQQKCSVVWRRKRLQHPVNKSTLNRHG